jgi:hypothetical protein
LRSNRERLTHERIVKTLIDLVPLLLDYPVRIEDKRETSITLRPGRERDELVLHQ